MPGRAAEELEVLALPPAHSQTESPGHWYDTLDPRAVAWPHVFKRSGLKSFLIMTSATFDVLLSRFGTVSSGLSERNHTS